MNGKMDIMDDLVDKYTFNRGFIARLSGIQITVYSLNFFKQIHQNCEKVPFIFTITDKTDREKMNNRLYPNSGLTLEIYPNLRMYVYMKRISGSIIVECEEYKCEIIKSEIIELG